MVRTTEMHASGGAVVTARCLLGAEKPCNTSIFSVHCFLINVLLNLRTQIQYTYFALHSWIWFTYSNSIYVLKFDVRTLIYVLPNAIYVLKFDVRTLIYVLPNALYVLVPSTHNEFGSMYIEVHIKVSLLLRKIMKKGSFGMFLGKVIHQLNHFTCKFMEIHISI
jgi:hypothetical protein